MCEVLGLTISAKTRKGKERDTSTLPRMDVTRRDESRDETTPSVFLFLRQSIHLILLPLSSRGHSVPWGTYREAVAPNALELPLWGALVYLPVVVSLSDVSAAFHVSTGCVRRQGAGAPAW